MKRSSFLFCLWLLSVFPVTSMAMAETLSVVSWGDTYEKAQNATIFKPFSISSGVTVNVVKYSGSIDGLVKRAESGGWDVIDMTEDQAIRACEQGLLIRLNPEEIIIPYRNTDIEEDFMPGSFRDCSIAHSVYSSVVAFDERAFKGEKPEQIADFFDLKRFPGKRAIRRDPSDILEWAMIAEGIPIRQVYDLLSTERGMRVAFARLETIRDQIVWWDKPQEAAKLLAEGKVSMAAGFNDGFFDLANEKNMPITIIWDAQIMDYAVWAIPASSKNIELGKQFIGFATTIDRMAELAEHIPYGPSRMSAFGRVGRHWKSQVQMREHLPNSSSNYKRALRRQSYWYTRTSALRHRRFNSWLRNRK